MTTKITRLSAVLLAFLIAAVIGGLSAIGTATTLVFAQGPPESAGCDPRSFAFELSHGRCFLESVPPHR
jgi:hypothetical protein